MVCRYQICSEQHYPAQSYFCLLDDDNDEDTGISEAIVTKSVLSDLCDEAAKLKSIGGMNQVRFDKPKKSCLLPIIPNPSTTQNKFMALSIPLSAMN